MREKLGLWTDHNIRDEDLSLFGWVITENIHTVDPSFVDRAHSLGVKVAAQMVPAVLDLPDAKNALRQGIERGIDIFHVEEFDTHPMWEGRIDATYLRELFGYGKSLKPDLICSLNEHEWDLEIYHQVFQAGVPVDQVMIMTYLDVEYNKNFIDILANLKIQYNIPYAFTWVNIADKMMTTFDWDHVGQPTTQYAYDHLDGVAFWVYYPLGCPDWAAGQPWNCTINFPKVKNWILSLIPTCQCTEWLNAECVNQNHRRQVRTCTPAGCDNEERIVYDPTCVPSRPRFPWELVFSVIVVGGVVYYAVGAR